MTKDEILAIWQRRKRAVRGQKFETAGDQTDVSSATARVFSEEFEVWAQNNRGVCSFYHGLAGDWEMFAPPNQRKKRGLVHVAPDPLAD